MAVPDPPSDVPSMEPSKAPSDVPSKEPSDVPSKNPSSQVSRMLLNWFTFHCSIQYFYSTILKNKLLVSGGITSDIYLPIKRIQFFLLKNMNA